MATATITKDKRPSVETSMHNVMEYAFVVHLHPTLVNGLMCSQNAKKELINLFGEKLIYIEYTDPGYVLFKKVDEKIREYRLRLAKEPQIIWLQNHGIFVAANTVEEIKSIYDSIFTKLEKAVKNPIPTDERATCSCTEEILPALRMMVSTENLKTLKVRKNELIKYFYDSKKHQQNIAKPFTPDQIVYCKSNYLFFNDEIHEQVIADAKKRIPEFVSKF